MVVKIFPQWWNWPSDISIPRGKPPSPLKLANMLNLKLCFLQTCVCYCSIRNYMICSYSYYLLASLSHSKRLLRQYKFSHQQDEVGLIAWEDEVERSHHRTSVNQGIMGYLCSVSLWPSNLEGGRGWGSSCGEGMNLILVWHLWVLLCLFILCQPLISVPLPPAPSHAAGHWSAPPHSEPSVWPLGRDPSTQWW